MEEEEEEEDGGEECHWTPARSWSSTGKWRGVSGDNAAVLIPYCVVHHVLCPLPAAPLGHASCGTAA